MKKNGNDFRGTVLIAAPLGKDAVLASSVLEQAGIAAQTCEGIREIAERLDESTNAIVVAAEALVAADVPLLLERLERQPTWSDIPLILLTTSGRGDEMSRRALDIFGPKANVTLLERPLQGVTLISTLKVALRARHRQ